MYNEYAFPVVILAYCRNSEANGNWCKTPEEIDLWLMKFVNYLVAEETYMQADLKAAKDNLTVKQYKEYQFEALRIDPLYKLEEVIGDELFFGMSETDVNDDHWLENTQTGEFANLIDYAKFSNRRNAYIFDNVPIDASDAIYMRNIMWSAKVQIYSREVTMALDVISEIGSLYYPVFFVGLVISFVFIDPLRRLDLAKAFSQLKGDICLQENLVTKEKQEENDFKLGGFQENKISACFYFFWWAY